MIFIGVNNITTPDAKRKFIELVRLYCSIAKEYSAKKEIIMVDQTDSISKGVVSELVSMGVIDSEKDLSLLEQVLTKSLYNNLINWVHHFLNNKKSFGTILDKLNNSKRKKLQEIEAHSNKPKIVDFFAGAGGLSLGFVHSGYTIALANDIEDVCVSTYKYNHPEVPSNRIIQGDIRKIVHNIKDYGLDNISLVVGGPPCQGFSSANQQRIIDDPRNELYKYFIKAVFVIAPKFVVMENVKGMLKVAGQVVEDFQNLKIEKDNTTYTYSVAYKLLVSSDFSVAQQRERLVYIAIRNDISDTFGISPSNIFEQLEQVSKDKKCYLLSDALAYIKELDAPRVKNMNEVDDEKTGKKVDANIFNGHDNEYLHLINEGRDIPLIYNHKARYVNDINYQIYDRLNQGDDATDSKIADIMPYAHRNHCFKDKYYKLIANKPSRTITAHLRMDCHSHIHPFQTRAITPREAARCQSFPDDFVYLGPYLKTYMQIGNAVPVLMAKEIATVIKQYL